MGEGENIKIKEYLEKFKENVSKEVLIKEMILFGSRVKGRTGKDTDIDLIVVSPEFRRMDFFERGAKMYCYWNIRYPVDFLCYTPQEFNKLKKQITIVRTAVKEGIEI